jgi:hypothetical protein
MMDRIIEVFMYQIEQERNWRKQGRKRAKKREKNEETLGE